MTCRQCAFLRDTCYTERLGENTIVEDVPDDLQ